MVGANVGDVVGLCMTACFTVELYLQYLTVSVAEVGQEVWDTRTGLVEVVVASVQQEEGPE